MMYTDGVLEATVRDSADRIGKEGLRRLVDAAMTRAAHDLVTEVLQDVHELHGGELVDDAALVVVGWGA